MFDLSRFITAPATTEISNLNGLFPRLLNIGILILLIAGYWLAYNFLVRFLYKKAKKYKYYSWQRLVLTILTIVLTIFTLVVAFVDNLSIFFGSISVLSAALVFALQDFVSCFFAWIYVEMSEQYEVGDIILFTTETRQVYGVVTEKGMFRTRIAERLGGITLDREMPTGRTITFPNNYIFKHSLTNITKNHFLLMHNFTVCVPFESDEKLANSVLQRVLQDKFNQLLKKPDRYFDSQVMDLSSYIPKVYRSIDDSGIAFTVWFGCRTGRLRTVMDEYSMAILEAFREQKIKIAHTTYRIINKQEN